MVRHAATMRLAIATLSSPGWWRQVKVMKRLGLPSMPRAIRQRERHSVQFGQPHLLHLTGAATCPKWLVATMDCSRQNMVVRSVLNLRGFRGVGGRAPAPVLCALGGCPNSARLAPGIIVRQSLFRAGLALRRPPDRLALPDLRQLVDDARIAGRIVAARRVFDVLHGQILQAPEIVQRKAARREA